MKPLFPLVTTITSLQTRLRTLSIFGNIIEYKNDLIDRWYHNRLHILGYSSSIQWSGEGPRMCQAYWWCSKRSKCVHISSLMYITALITIYTRCTGNSSVHQCSNDGSDKRCGAFGSGVVEFVLNGSLGKTLKIGQEAAAFKVSQTKQIDLWLSFTTYFEQN